MLYKQTLVEVKFAHIGFSPMFSAAILFPALVAKKLFMLHISKPDIINHWHAYAARVTVVVRVHLSICLSVR